MFSSDTPVTCKGLRGCRGGGRLVIVCHGCLCVEGWAFAWLQSLMGVLQPPPSFSALVFNSLQLCFILTRPTSVWIQSVTQQQHYASYKCTVNKPQLKIIRFCLPTAAATEELPVDSFNLRLFLQLLGFYFILFYFSASSDKTSVVSSLVSCFFLFIF